MFIYSRYIGFASQSRDGSDSTLRRTKPDVKVNPCPVLHPLNTHREVADPKRQTNSQNKSEADQKFRTIERLSIANKTPSEKSSLSKTLCLHQSPLPRIKPRASPVSHSSFSILLLLFTTPHLRYPTLLHSKIYTPASKMDIPSSCWNFHLFHLVALHYCCRIPHCQNSQTW